MHLAEGTTQLCSSAAPQTRGSGGLIGNLRNKLGRKNSTSPPSSRSGSFAQEESGKQNKSKNLPVFIPSSSSASPPTRRPYRSGMNAFSKVPNEPPPSYSATISGSSSTSTSTAPTTASSSLQQLFTETADDKYVFLSSFDTVFLIDDSGSMAGRSWRETQAALTVITPICTSHDADGIDIHFLNAKDNPWFRNVKSSSTVGEIFSTVRPQGGTPTGQRLNQILKPYLARYAAKPDTTKPLNVIVITDGEPSDDVESTIISAAKKLDRLDAPAWQVGIQFFQVGNEAGAREHLKMLDDELADLAGDDNLRDMVDTVPWTHENGGKLNAEGILKVVLGAVTRRLDRRRSKDLYTR